MPSKSDIVSIMTVWLIYRFKKQRKSSFFCLPIFDSRCIKIYISKPCLEWECLQIVDLFFFSFLFIKTSSNQFSNNIFWIKSNKYNYWYYIFDIFGSFLIVKIPKLSVKIDDATIAAQKNERILAEIPVKA